MTNYKAYFRTDSEFATLLEIEADTPEQALSKAQANDRSGLWFESYVGMPVNEIAIKLDDDEPSEELAVWRDDDLRLRLAARNLLDALEELVARDRADAADSGFTDDEMTCLEDARRAIAKAKGGAS